MDSNKAPGLDGMTFLFFQKFWNIIKEDFINAIKSFFHSALTLKTFKHTVISLIPKIPYLTDIKQYRPISLCNMVYKAIAKILVTRLKPMLHHFISINQSAFIPGRHILDNIIISHEYVHYLKNKRQGKDGFMVVKLDMSKAYDRVEWNFLQSMISKMSFCNKWIKWIIYCISTVSFSFNVNRDRKEYLKPQRGITQDDPLSPYLFLLYSEGFSNLLKKAASGEKNQWNQN